MSVCCECCVLSDIGLCVGLIAHPEEPYPVVCVCDRETSIMRRPWSSSGRCALGGRLQLKLHLMK
jgi:hypothetical protein